MRNSESIQANDVNESNDQKPLRASLNDYTLEWIDSINSETKRPKPFDLDLEDFYTQSALKSIIAGKTKEESEEIIRNNHEALLRNNEKIGKLNDRIIEISELGEADLKLLYGNENTSDSDKSIISCVEILRLFYNKSSWYDEDWNIYRDVAELTDGLYGFDLIRARGILETNNSHFKILTKKERDELSPGSLEDIASAALESFVMNPNYTTGRIADYDDYLYGIMLDCTKRKLKKEYGVDKIKEEVDLEEFQDRVIESMSWALVDEESKDKEYSEEEFKQLVEQSADVHANYLTGHHFRNDFETHIGRVRIAGKDGSESIYGLDYPDRAASFSSRFRKKIQSNNDEVFRYSFELANAEMKQWADKIDLDEIERINNDDKMSYEQKLSSMTLYVQNVFGVQNLDENGQSRPIEIKWFRFQESKLKKALRKLFNTPVENEDLPEEYAGAFYKHSERSIYYLKESNSKRKLSDWMIGTVVHEMWHAKQYELGYGEEKDRTLLINGDSKARMYHKNTMAYFYPVRTVLINGNRRYNHQLLEREAHALDSQIEGALFRRHLKQRGRKLLSFIRVVE